MKRYCVWCAIYHDFIENFETVEEAKEYCRNQIKKALDNFIENYCLFGNPKETIIGKSVEGVIFPDWHNERYLKQCLANLSEKYDCGGIPESEWKEIKMHFPDKLLYLYEYF